MEILEIPIDAILLQNRLRVVDAAWVENLVASIRVSGLQQPLQVRAVGDGQFVLVAGAHRLVACRRLEMPTVPCHVVECTDLQARLMEIDENLYRHELSPLDRAAFLAERKKVYEALYPETKHGVAATNARLGRQNDKMSFCDSTAKSTGLNRRTVERAVSLHDRLDPRVRELLAGTWISKNQAELTALSRLDSKDQMNVLKHMELGDVKGDSLSVAQAINIVRHNQNPETTVKKVDDDFERIKNIWIKTRPTSQQMFIDYLIGIGEVMRPVKKRPS